MDGAVDLGLRGSMRSGHSGVHWREPGRILSHQYRGRAEALRQLGGLAILTKHGIPFAILFFAMAASLDR